MGGCYPSEGVWFLWLWQAGAKAGASTHSGGAALVYLPGKHKRAGTLSSVLLCLGPSPIHQHRMYPPCLAFLRLCAPAVLQFFKSHFTVGSKAAFIALPTFGIFW